MGAKKRSAALGAAALFLLCGSPAFGQATTTTVGQPVTPYPTGGMPAEADVAIGTTSTPVGSASAWKSVFVENTGAHNVCIAWGPAAPSAPSNDTAASATCASGQLFVPGASLYQAGNAVPSSQLSATAAATGAVLFWRVM